MNTKAYINRIKAKAINVGVVGLGYVGLPLSLSFVRAGFHVTALDIDKSKVQKLLNGYSYIHHISDTEIAEARSSGRLLPTADFDHVDHCDAVIICVPTPLNKNREPDMSYIVSTAHKIKQYLRPETLVILESTTWPGTTEEIVRPILASAGAKVGENTYLAFSPEREDPGNAKYNTTSIPKLVGGCTPECTEVAAALYAAALDKVVPVSSSQVAEMAKLLENIFRSVNIALVNELKVLCHQMGIDIFEVIKAASTKPFGFMPFYPGPGLGGHCIPIDPFYLTWKAREFEQPTRFIELAGEINTNMPHYTLERIAFALNGQRKSVKGARIMILGAAYKPNVDDMRESPALKILELLQERGAQVAYHDPYVPELLASRRYDLRLKSLALTKDNASVFDAAVIVTDHKSVDYQAVCDWFPLVIDCRNATAGLQTRGKVLQA